MQLAPLRPRRRRTTVDSPATTRVRTVTPRSTNLSAIAARIAGLIDGPVSEALVVMLTELYGDALARVLVAIEAAPDSAAILERMCADELVGGLLVVHDLHPLPLSARIAGALATLAPTLSPPICVVLERIEEDVAYVRSALTLSITARAAVARVIAEVAPEITRVSVDVASEDEFALLA